MPLDMNACHRDDDRFDVSFKALGELIETVGTPHFVPRLTRLLNDVVPLDVAHVERSRVDGAMPTGYRCEWIGSSGIGTATAEISDVMTLYYERFLDSDPLFAGLRGKTGTMLVVRDIAAIPPGEFRQRLFDDVRIGHECVLARGTRYAQHSIALERGRDRPPFTLAEMNRFRSISDVLFPLLELHASTTAARRIAHPAADLHPLAQFDARLAADGVKLSKREYETCKHLLSGKTVPETAEILGVRVATAESYVKRVREAGRADQARTRRMGAAAPAFRRPRERRTTYRPRGANDRCERRARPIAEAASVVAENRDRRDLRPIDRAADERRHRLLQHRMVRGRAYLLRCVGVVLRRRVECVTTCDVAGLRLRKSHLHSFDMSLVF
jgi:hypothetical protein